MSFVAINVFANLVIVFFMPFKSINWKLILVSSFFISSYLQMTYLLMRLFLKVIIFRGFRLCLQSWRITLFSHLACFQPFFGSSHIAKSRRPKTRHLMKSQLFSESDISKGNTPSTYLIFGRNTCILYSTYIYISLYIYCNTTYLRICFSGF